jgi:SAM-dependent methyltransferase
MQAYPIRNPKQKRGNLEGTASWYPYYAGFCDEFAREVLSSTSLPPGASVLDSWNGSGTTTTVARSLGLRATGFDLNPVMVITARARLLSGREYPSLDPIARDILKKASCSTLQAKPHDPLCLWLMPSSAAVVRRLEEGIQELLIGCPIAETTALRYQGRALSNLAAFYYVVIFRLVRRLLESFIPSNPTWVKRPRQASERLAPAESLIYDLFLSYIREMSGVSTARIAAETDFPETDILLGDSANLPIPDGSMNFVLSSPPYCTRIDYAVATLPELAVLRFELAGSFTELRRRLIGSTTVPAQIETPSVAWGSICQRFLDRMLDHVSKASSTYYYKSHCQYFAGLHRSLKEIARVLSPGSRCVLVVQDSYYKDIHNDLPGIVEEMLETMGMVWEERVDFASRTLMANINPKARRYRTHTRAVESVLRLRKI